MNIRDLNIPYDNISQRVAYAHLRFMAEPLAVIPDGTPANEGDAMAAAQRDLHAFFTALYEAIYECAEAFGMPTAADFYVNNDGTGGSKDKAEVNRKIKTARETMERGLDLLQEMGRGGRLDRQTLVVETAWLSEILMKARSTRKFLAGLQQVGLITAEDGAHTRVNNARFPRMMPALQQLSQACGQIEDSKAAAFYFARCDFRALDRHYLADPADLYRVFNPGDVKRLLALHEYFLERGYKTEVVIYGTHGWEVKYQGSRKVKATALYQVQFHDREKVPLKAGIKCASTGRIAHMIPQQSAALQDDFRRRVNICQADKCNWCKDKKGLGPATLNYRDEQITICWYTNPDIHVLDDEMVGVVKEYAELHEKLDT